MNQDETARLLKLRAQLVSNPYGPDTIAAWTLALNDLGYDDAKSAVLALANAGHTSITVPAIRNHLRPATPPRPTRVHTDPPGDPHCICGGSGWRYLGDPRGGLTRCDCIR